MPPKIVRYNRLQKTVIVFITNKNAVASLNRQNVLSKSRLNVNFTKTFSAVSTDIVVVVTIITTTLVITVTVLSVCTFHLPLFVFPPSPIPPPNCHPFL